MKIHKHCLFLLFLLLSSVSYADSTTTSSTDASSDVMSVLKEKMALTYFGIYRGASLSSPGNSLQPNTDGTLDPTSPQSLETYLTTGYKINKDVVIGLSNHFYASPLGMPATNGTVVEMLDPSIVISKAKWINTNGFTVKGLLFVELPVTYNDYLRKHQMLATVSPTLNMNYDLPGSSLSIGLYTYIKAYVPSGDTNDINGPYKSYKIYGAPNANYQLSKTLSATMWIDLVQVTRSTGTGFISGMDNFTADVEPGINWEFIPGFNFNPMLNIYPATPTMAATSIQAVITGKFF